MKKVSVIIPVFNRQELIAAAIDSALAQTYTDVEVVVVDDGSTDDTAKVLNSYGNAINAIFQDNRGQSAARNTGLAACSGQYVLFLDSDDCLEPHAIEMLLSGLQEKEKTSTDWGLAYGKMLTCDENLRPLKNQRKRYYSGNVLLPILFDNFVRTGTYLVEKNILDAVGGFKEDLVVREDRLLLFSIAARTQFHFVDQFLVRYRRHEGPRARQNSLPILNQGARHLDYFFTETPNPLPPSIIKAKARLYGLLHIDLFKIAWRNRMWCEAVDHFRAAVRHQKRYFLHPKYVTRALVSWLICYERHC